MRGKSTVRTMAAAFVVVLFLSMSALAKGADKKPKVEKSAASQTDCSKTTDAEIVAAIKAQFEADAEIKNQMRHINISVKKRSVKLEGWLDGKALIEKAIALAKQTKCVRKVTSKLKENGGGSCGPGQRPCGDTCIDRRSECMILN
jgi:osmotically-inducible protein OsmY